MLGKPAAVFNCRAEDLHLLERAHRAHRFELTAGLESRPEQAEDSRFGPREIFRRDAAGRADARALHDAVIDDREKLPRCGRKQQHLAVVAPARFRQREFHPPRRSVDRRACDDVGIEPDGGHARLGPSARHRFQIVHRALSADGHDRILTRNVDRIAIAEIGERRLDCLDAIWHLQKRFDIFIGEQDHLAGLVECARRP
jgi:hypothetical protein